MESVNDMIIMGNMNMFNNGRYRWMYFSIGRAYKFQNFFKTVLTFFS